MELGGVRISSRGSRAAAPARTSYAASENAVRSGAARPPGLGVPTLAAREAGRVRTPCARARRGRGLGVPTLAANDRGASESGRSSRRLRRGIAAGEASEVVGGRRLRRGIAGSENLTSSAPGLPASWSRRSRRGARGERVSRRHALRVARSSWWRRARATRRERGGSGREARARDEVDRGELE